MKSQLLKLTHIRKRERKSLFLILTILLFSSFCDELYLSLLATSESQEIVINLDKKEAPLFVKDSIRNEPEIVVSEPKKERSFENSPNTKPINIKKVQTNPSKIRHEGIVQLPNAPKSKLNTRKIDPNQVNMDDLLASGVSRKVARTWINFSKAGGKFYKKEDLKKIYGISEAEVNKIAENLIFPQKIKSNPYEKLSTIYLNQATAHDFAKISGIGPVLSERIIKLRDRLGGFHSEDQLKEVYGVEEELIEKNKNLFVIEKSVVKININTCSEKQLGAHSYCSYRTAKAIINYREQHGNFANKDDFLEIRILDNSWIDKISPYFEY